MPTPTERFKEGYANHRWNPFTDADMAVDKTEDNLYIPNSAPFVLQLLEVPRKNTPSSVVIYNYSDEIYMTEVLTPPTQGQFRVDYPSPDGEGTGLVEFNSNDNNKQIRVEYKATGSPMVSEFLDSKISWPAGSPGQNQTVIFKSSVPTWAYRPDRYFHEDNALYHPSGGDQSCFCFRFKMDSNQSKIFMLLFGALVHQGFYTELTSHAHTTVSHAHASGTLAGTQPTHVHVTDETGGHQHTVDDHAHAAGGLAGSQPVHRHTYLTGEGPDLTGEAGADAVSISGVTAGAAPGTSAVGNHQHNVNPSGNDAVSISGSVAAAAPDTNAAGTTPKTYPDQLIVFLDGLDKTAQILALSGLDKLGDGTAGHLFITTGTGEMDVTSLFGGGTWHTIVIKELIANKGGRVLLNVELY